MKKNIASLTNRKIQRVSDTLHKNLLTTPLLEALAFKIRVTQAVASGKLEESRGARCGGISEENVEESRERVSKIMR